MHPKVSNNHIGDETTVDGQISDVMKMAEWDGTAKGLLNISCEFHVRAHTYRYEDNSTVEEFECLVTLPSIMSMENSIVYQQRVVRLLQPR